MKNNILIFTDGSCSGKNRVGAWCSVIIKASDPDTILDYKIITGGSIDTTISRCELEPILAALDFIDNTPAYVDIPITIVSDSEYTVKKLSQGGHPGSSNTDLWIKANKAITNKTIRFIHRSRNSTNMLSFCDNTANTLYNGLKTMFASVIGKNTLNIGLTDLNKDLNIWLT